jgi:hypothetical protein
MITMNRVFIAILIALAGIWIWADIRAQQEKAAANAFYVQQVAPSFEAEKRQEAVFEQALHDHHEIKEVPLPMLSNAPFDEWMQHVNRCNHYISIRELSVLGLMGTMLVWTISVQIQVAVRRRRQQSSERPAAPDAGKLIGEWMQTGRAFVAKTEDDGMAEKVEVDTARAVVVFHHFAFITAFVGNPKRDRTEVPFTDIIAGSLSYNKGRSFLTLRTTYGKVVITDNVRPFQALAGLLLDMTELNRTAPDQYRATLAREPHVRTPWYGWLIIAAAVASVFGAFWWNYSH